MQKILSTIFFSSLSFVVLAQISISGKVLSGADGQAIAYVNLGIKNKNVGTVTAENGTFTLSFHEKYSDDTLTFSCVGYNEKNIPLKRILEENILDFSLDPKIIVLREVEIFSREPKIKIYGCSSENGLVSACPRKDSAFKDIAEVAQLIKTGRSPLKIVSAHIFLKEVACDTAMLRINFYKYENGEPSARLLEKKIMKTLSVKNGWNVIEMEDFSVVLKEDFMMSIEFLPVVNCKYFCYGGALGFGTMFFRESSLGKWEKIPPVATPFYVCYCPSVIPFRLINFVEIVLLLHLS